MFDSIMFEGISSQSPRGRVSSSDTTTTEVVFAGCDAEREHGGRLSQGGESEEWQL